MHLSLSVIVFTGSVVHSFRTNDGFSAKGVHESNLTVRKYDLICESYTIPDFAEMLIDAV